MRYIALKMSYDGTAYHGWQIQKNAVSVCQTLKNSLEKTCGAVSVPVGCGRTDAGVHAKIYCAAFRTDSAIPRESLPLAVNSRLPDDISIKAAADVPDDFCPIRSCIAKEYTYIIHNSRVRDPFLKNRACFYTGRLDTELMRQAAEYFIGTHDFAAVRSVGTETKTTVRTVYGCEVIRGGDLIKIKIRADGFLYNMARAIAGTLVYAGNGKIAPGDIPALLKSRDRRLAGPTMPPGGLYMTALRYGGEVGKMFADGVSRL